MSRGSRRGAAAGLSESRGPGCSALCCRSARGACSPAQVEAAAGDGQGMGADLACAGPGPGLVKDLLGRRRSSARLDLREGPTPPQHAHRHTATPSPLWGLGPTPTDSDRLRPTPTPDQGEARLGRVFGPS